MAFEVLVRSGVGAFSTVDRDVFEPSNLNRQIYAFRHTLGRRKIDVAEQFARAINPEVRIDAYDHVDEDNVGRILEGCDVAVLAIDSLRPCLVISRKARELGVPVVEGWALPYANVRVLTPDTPSLEEVYDLPTRGRDIAEVSDEEIRRLQFGLLTGSLGRIEGVADFYDDAAVRRIAAGHITSFAPMVWLTSVMMATEALKVLLDWGEPALAPAFALYDPFRHRVPGVREALPADRRALQEMIAAGAGE